MPRMAEVTPKTRSNVVRVRVTDEERAFLERVAREDDRSMSNVLRMALKLFYEQRMDRAA